jgi:hypothetical protein
LATPPLAGPSGAWPGRKSPRWPKGPLDFNGDGDTTDTALAVDLNHLFLADQTDVPTVVVDHLAAQLGIADPSALKGYGETAIRFKHAAAIRERVGYSDFNDQPGHWRFIRWLYTRAYVAGERHIVLFDLSTVRLVEAKILLPGASTLERLIATVKERAATQLWRALGAIPDEGTGKRLLALLVVHPAGRDPPWPWDARCGR